MKFTAMEELYQKQRYDYDLQVQGWIAVNLACQHGSLVKPRLCEYCGLNSPRDFHHTDYANPLEGKWACRSCHRKEHERIKRILKGTST